MSASAVQLQPVTPEPPRTVAQLRESVSATRLTTWLQCRLKFWFRYLSGIQKPKPPALLLGSAVHELLRFWNRARWHGASPTLSQLHEAFAAAWKECGKEDPVDWQGEEAVHKVTAWKLCETYFRESPIPPNEKPEAVEVAVETDLSAHGLPKLIGVIDLVRGGGRIVDFKTTGRTPDPAQLAHTTEPQTTAYAMLYRAARERKETGIELHSLVKLKSPRLVVTPVPPASEGKINRLLHQIESYTNGLDREEFIPSPGMACASCEFFEECRAWTGTHRKEHT